MKRVNRAPMGGTKKVTISLRESDLDLITRYAKRLHGNNLSAAFAELIADAARLDAMDRVIEMLPPASPEGIAQIEAEMAAPLPPPPRRRKKAAAA